LYQTKVKLHVQLNKQNIFQPLAETVMCLYVFNVSRQRKATLDDDFIK